MFCIYCGNKLDDDSVFCPKCGKKTGADEVKQAESPTEGENTSESAEESNPVEIQEQGKAEEPVEDVKPAVTEASATAEGTVSAVVAETEGNPSVTAERPQSSEPGKECKTKMSKILLVLLIAELVTNPYWLSIPNSRLFVTALLSPFPTCIAYVLSSKIYKFFGKKKSRMSAGSIVLSEIVSILLVTILFVIYAVYYIFIGQFIA
ncbi:MAG: zinc-ribbon domain-containing protein [Treponema sp.]|nr:zinc-ribbon domain-containing protein [Treponema sp.]